MVSLSCGIFSKLEVIIQNIIKYIERYMDAFHFIGVENYFSLLGLWVRLPVED